MAGSSGSRPAAPAAAIVVVVAAVLVVRSCSDGSASAARPAGDGANAHAGVATEGMHAPGTAELRALGCSHALVVDMAKLLGAGSRVRDGEPGTMVTCDVPPAVDPPTCEHAAGVYFGAIGGTAEQAVGIRVLREGSTAPLCSRLYAPNGADLGVFPRVR